jgi:hypothetical protein
MHDRAKVNAGGGHVLGCADAHGVAGKSCNQVVG